MRFTFKARECVEAGEAVAEYQNSFNWYGGNGAPLTQKDKNRKRGKKGGVSGQEVRRSAFQ